jgi:glycosyltransferase involved in cell wall biosynthesis
MKALCIAIGVVVFTHALSIAVAATDIKKQKLKIGLMTASLPWSFGPYQGQMHQLSLLLSDSKDDDAIEYDIYWINYADPWLPKGAFKSYEEMRKHIPDHVPPQPGFPMEHLTFLGQAGVEDGHMTTKKFNDVMKEYSLDCLVTLMDITKVQPNDDFIKPVVAWIPLHSETVSSATPDYWVLRKYHGIAALAPSSAKAIDDAVGKDAELAGELEKENRVAKAYKKMVGNVQVDFIPHIFDQKAISASADVGLELLKDHSAAEADAKLKNMPLINRGQESTLESGHARSLFGKERKDDFVVLMQGGNYEEHDRKGWDTSLQAFRRFYDSLDDPSGVHLHIHSMESYLIASDSHGDKDAPAYIMPKGVSLHYVLHEHGLPRDAYTIDIAKHAPEVVAAYKKRADVCLHPSKVEGFGMNVMECQVVGTPVITTNYTAMGDFTKIGRSVPTRQTIRTPHFIYDMAMPDVIGIADALGEMYEEHQAMKRGQKEALARREGEVLRFNDWLDKNCSPRAVGDKFKDLLLRSYSEVNDRNQGKQQFFSGKMPSFGGYQTVLGYHTPIVHGDEPWALLGPEGLKVVDPETLNRAAWKIFTLGAEAPMSMILPAKYEDGTKVPFQNAERNNVHEDLPILVQSPLMTALQGRMSRRKSLALSAIQLGEPPMMREGFVVIERNKESRTRSSQYQDSEL